MFAAIFIPDFALEAIVRAEPLLRERPVAVLEGAPPLERVIIANAKAQTAGAAIGLTKAQAEQAPGVVLRARSSDQEAAAHAALLDCAYAFSPRVEDAAVDMVLLDIAGLERIFGSPQKIARDLARKISEIGLESQLGVASNLETASHAARGFAGVTIIAPGEEALRLGPLSVDVLAPAPEILQTLDSWGIRNLRALASLPPIPLSERLGAEGLRLQKLARGEGSRPLVPTDPPLHFEEATELEHPLEMLEPLAFVLNRMLESLCARLQARALATNELQLRMELENRDAVFSRFHPEPAKLTPGANHTAQVLRLTQKPALAQDDVHKNCLRSIRLPVPMLDAKVFLKLLQLDLEAHPPQAPVRKILLQMEPARPRQSQNGLFLAASPEPERLELVLARVAGVVGEKNLGVAEILDTHRADAFRMRRFAPVSSSRFPVLRKNKTNGVASSSKLAMRRYRPPLRANVLTHAGEPVRVSFLNVRGEVTACAGPWRTSGEWWSNDGWSRDEWDVAVQQKNGLALYRMYRDLASESWFVEARYD
jgi:protein ImuB